ncbi:hypothetical protein YC2023_008692 [Brassica napus]
MIRGGYKGRVIIIIIIWIMRLMCRVEEQLVAIISYGEKSRGRVKDIVRNKSVKSRRWSMDDAQNLDTQRNLAIDFAGTRVSISMSRSTGIRFEDCDVSCLENSCFNLFTADGFYNPNGALVGNLKSRTSQELARRCNTLIRLIKKEIQELDERERERVLEWVPKLDRSSSRIVKHALFEQACKNMCSSRYNSLLLESFSQIVSYGKSFQRKGSTRSLACNR